MLRDGKHLEPQDGRTESKESKESEISEWPQSEQEGGYQGLGGDYTSKQERWKANEMAQ